MEPRRNPPEYFLEIFADTNSVKDVLKGRKLLFYYIYSVFRR
jgi:autophagy-related protein 101